MATRRQQRARTSVFAPFAQNMRLLSMILMLVVIGITVHRNGRWGAPAMVAGPVAAQNDAAPPHQPDEPDAKTPAAAEAAQDQPATADSVPADDALVDEPANDPDSMNSDRSVDALAGAAPSPRDDRDPEEATEFRRQAEAIADWALAIQGIENPAYWRLLEWINRQPLAELKERDPQAAVFQQLRQHPGRYRGKLLSLELSVRRVVTYDVEKENPAGVKRLYELWGWPTAGRGWFYVVVTPELPPGFPIEADVTQTVRVYGYFFKLQGYQPANAPPNAAPLAAPMIVGRVDWIQLITPTNPAETALSYVILAAGSVLVLGVIGFWIINGRRKKLAHQSRTENWPGVSTHEADDSEEFNTGSGYDRDSPKRNSFDRDDDKHDSDRPPPGAFDWVRD